MPLPPQDEVVDSDPEIWHTHTFVYMGKKEVGEGLVDYLMELEEICYLVPLHWRIKGEC